MSKKINRSMRKPKKLVSKEYKSEPINNSGELVDRIIAASQAGDLNAAYAAAFTWSEQLSIQCIQQGRELGATSAVRALDATNNNMLHLLEDAGGDNEELQKLVSVWRNEFLEDEKWARFIAVFASVSLHVHNSILFRIASEAVTEVGKTAANAYLQELKEQIENIQRGSLIADTEVAIIQNEVALS